MFIVETLSLCFHSLKNLCLLWGKLAVSPWIQPVRIVGGEEESNFGFGN